MNTRKTFGEYLVEKGIISPEALLEAWISQIGSIPSIAEIVHKNSIFRAPDLVKALALQLDKRVEFVTACKELGLWTESIENQVQKIVDDLSVPLVKILLEKKAATIDQINKSLDAYLSESGEKKESPKLRVVNGSIVEFGDQFNKDSYDTLISFCESSEDSGLAVQISELIHRLVGASRFAQLDRLHSFFGVLEMSVRLKSSAPELIATMKAGIEAAWQLRNFILEEGGEQGFELKHSASDQGLVHSIKTLETAVKPVASVGG